MSEMAFDSEEGTISFWIDDGAIRSDEQTELVEVSDSGGGIRLTAVNGEVKYEFVRNGGGRAEVQSGRVESDTRHMIAATWDMGTGGIELFINGVSVGTASV